MIYWWNKLNYILGCTAITLKHIISTLCHSASFYSLFLNIYASSLPSLHIYLSHMVMTDLLADILILILSHTLTGEWNNIMLQDMSHVKWCIGPEAIPLAGDWGAAGHIHLDQWQSSIRLDQSEAKDEQRRTTYIFSIQKNPHEGRTCS